MKKEAETFEKEKKKREDIKWLIKFLVTWVIISVIPFFAITAAYYYCDPAWVTVVIALVVGFLATVIILRFYDGLKK